MAHIVLIEDDNGDVVDGNWYCSDHCAQTDDAYAGWFGAQYCHYKTTCNFCGKPVGATDTELEQL